MNKHDYNNFQLYSYTLHYTTIKHKYTTYYNYTLYLMYANYYNYTVPLCVYMYTNFFTNVHNLMQLMLW